MISFKEMAQNARDNADTWSEQELLEAFSASRVVMVQGAAVLAVSMATYLLSGVAWTLLPGALGLVVEFWGVAACKWVEGVFRTQPRFAEWRDGRAFVIDPFFRDATIL